MPSQPHAIAISTISAHYFRWHGMSTQWNYAPDIFGVLHSRLKSKCLNSEFQALD